MDLLERVRAGPDLVVLEDRAKRGTAVDSPTLRVDHGDQVAHVLGDEAEALLALAQLLLGAPMLGHVAEAPHAADRLPFDELRPGGALEDAPVLENEDVEAFPSGMRVELAHLGAELLGVLQLPDHVIEGVVVAPGGEDARRNAPHLSE